MLDDDDMIVRHIKEDGENDPKTRDNDEIQIMMEQQR